MNKIYLVILMKDRFVLREREREGERKRERDRDRDRLIDRQIEGERQQSTE